MNRIQTIALFAGVFAVTMGALSITGFSGISATSLMTEAIPQTYERTGMIGHVTYTLFDANGNIKSYIQGDNVVTDPGKDCTALLLFDNATDPGKCAEIGNHSAGAPDGAETELDRDSGTGVGACATSGASNGGEMARLPGTVTFTASASQPAGTITEIVTTQPFTFDVNNATTVDQAGLFDEDEETKDGNRQCTALGTSNLFSVQDITVLTTTGDSLSVKWTITID